MSAERGKHQGNRDPSLKEGTVSGRIFGKAIGLEIMNRIAGYSVGLRKMRNWTLWRGQPLPKLKRAYWQL
jgi:hypothetical protein